MSDPAADSSALVYVQDDNLVMLLGEPLPLDELSRIVVAKWDAIYAEALRGACSRAFPATPVQICRRGGETLALLRDRMADFVVIGLTFPDVDGIDLLQTIIRERLSRRVVIVSGRKDEHSLQALRAARFDGLFDPHEETLDVLVTALQQIADGRGYVSPSLCRRMFTQRSAGVLAPRLTPAELQVLSIIGDGSDDGEAAARLGVSESTIATHRRALMRKLDVPTSAKLVREAIRLGVVRITPDGEVVRPGFAAGKPRGG